MSCPVCDREDMLRVLAVPDVPVFCNVLWPTREEALASARGPIDLRFCETCGMLRNVAFDPELVRYSPSYENSLHFSPAFRAFAGTLAQRLIDRYELHAKDIVDIGSGKGEFLSLLCNDETQNRGTGYDPSYAGQAVANGHLRFVREPYTRAHAALPADLISCRHVLEHLDEPRDLLRTLERSPATLYFEMPDAGYMLREAAIWDVIYEHPSYFTAPALRRLFESGGYGVIDIGTSFGDQYLHVEAIWDGRDRPVERVPADLSSKAAAFGREYEEKVGLWSGRLAQLLADDRRVAVWGAGSKGVSFLNTVDGATGVELVVDLNERKHGRFLPGTGHEVRPPSAVQERPPDVVLAMNPLYVGEIRGALAASGVAADVIAV